MKSRKPASPERAEGGLWVKSGYTRGPDVERPLVSVITVCRNSEKTLERTIESVLGQTYTDIEYIIVDGGSTDGTLDIIRKYEDRVSYWVSEPDEGIYDAMNKGISLATGDLVGIINSDDWYFPDAVQEVVSASLEDPAAQVFFGQLHVVDEDGRFQWVLEGSCWDIEHKFQMGHPTCFVRRAVYDDYLYRTKYRLLADYDLMLRLHLAGMRFNRLEKPLALFRTGGASSAYYRTRADSYEIRWDHGLMSAWRYVYKRLALIFKAPLHWLREAVARRCFKEIDALRAACGDLRADSLAMKDEIERASAHIAKLEREIEEKNALIEHLGERIRKSESAVQAPITPGSPALGKLACYIRTEGLPGTLRRAYHHFIGKARVPLPAE